MKLIICYDQDDHANIPYNVNQVNNEEDHKKDDLQLRILSDAYKDELSHNWVIFYIHCSKQCFVCVCVFKFSLLLNLVYFLSWDVLTINLSNYVLRIL